MVGLKLRKLCSSDFSEVAEDFAGGCVVGIKNDFPRWGTGLFRGNEAAGAQRAKAKEADSGEADRVVAFPRAETAKPDEAAKMPKREAPRCKIAEPWEEAETWNRKNCPRPT